MIRTNDYCIDLEGVIFLDLGEELAQKVDVAHEQRDLPGARQD
jgi:hypothetical protein